MMRVFILISILFLSGCQDNDGAEEMVTIFADRQMTIDYKIIIGQKTSSEQDGVIHKIIKSTFEEINAIYNKWNPNSELSQLNQLPADKVIGLSPQLENLLLQTEQVVELSQGLFDPTIEPLQSLWKAKLEQGSIPSDEEIAAVLPLVGWDKIHFGNGFFYKDEDATSLDLGGIAKGFGVDLLLERLVRAGFSNVFVEWGGEIRTEGEHPEGRPWTIYISRLANMDPEKAIAHVALKDCAIATSGDYLQNWTIKTDHGNSVFFHIFDPKTGRPMTTKETTVASASVIAPTCALADGLATVAMMFPSLDEAEAWANKMQERDPTLKFWLISREKL